jgi:hypothetical protein
MSWSIESAVRRQLQNLQADFADHALRYPHFYSVIVFGEPRDLPVDTWIVDRPDRARLPRIGASWRLKPCFVEVILRGDDRHTTVSFYYFGEPAAFLPFRELVATEIRLQASLPESELKEIPMDVAPEYSLWALHVLARGRVPGLPSVVEVYRHQDSRNWPSGCRVSVMLPNVFRTYNLFLGHSIERMTSVVGGQGGAGDMVKDWIVCSQAELARVEGFGDHYSGLMDVLKERGIVSEFEWVSARKVRFIMADPKKHADLKGKLTRPLRQPKRQFQGRKPASK